MSDAFRRTVSELEAVRQEAVTAEIADWFEDDPDEAHISGQFTVYYSQLDALTKSAVEHAERTNLSPADFRSGPLKQVCAFVKNLQMAFVKDAWGDDGKKNKLDTVKQLNFWRHEPNPLAFVTAKQVPYIDRAYIESDTGKYLNLPFRSAAMDRLLVDVLIGMEVYGFADEMLNEPKPLLGPPRSPLNLRHPLRVFLVGQLSSGLIFLGGAALVAFASERSWIGESWAIGISLVLIALFLLGLVTAILAMPFYWRNRSKLRLGVRDKLDSMLGVYQELSSSGPISARRIREIATDATTKGVVWPSPLFALLDDIEGRSGRF